MKSGCIRIMNQWRYLLLGACKLCKKRLYAGKVRKSICIQESIGGIGCKCDEKCCVSRDRSKIPYNRIYDANRIVIVVNIGGNMTYFFGGRKRIKIASVDIKVSEVVI